MSGFETEVDALVARVAALLTARGWRMATAESCTGGWIAKCCTDREGSSAWFEGAYVSYSYRSKEQMLGVDHQDLQQHGAVSECTALQMADGARRRADADVVVAVTGIAGPGGSVPGKPVGLVHFGWCLPGRPACGESRIFAGDRREVRQQAVLFALEGVLSRLQALA